MIDHKKIEKAAEEYANHDWISDDCCLAYEDGFKAGINWLLDNLWHDVKEEPEQNKPLLVQYEEHGEIYFIEIEHLKSDEISWCESAMADGITKWLYIDDLLKGGE